MSVLKIGLVINPIAGVGAALAWKGTDDIDAAWKAVQEGKTQPVWDIVRRALESIPHHLTIEWYFGGEYHLDQPGEILFQPKKKSTRDDTIQAVRILEENGVTLIVFAGGDGTAADVASSTKLPILGIPAGVKIFSPCFLHRPEDLGDFLLNWEGETLETDILDLDEEAYRQGKAVSKLVTSAKIPLSSTIQAGKISWNAPDSETYKLIAERIEDEGWLDQTIIVGPGSTMKNIFEILGIELSLLGVDIVSHGEIILYDGTKEEIDHIDADQIWITPIGNQGHIFGRGNRQISAAKISEISKKEIRVFSTLEKTRETEALYVDTGDADLDRDLRGFIPVIVGYHEEILKRIK